MEGTPRGRTRRKVPFFWILNSHFLPHSMRLKRRCGFSINFFAHSGAHLHKVQKTDSWCKEESAWILLRSAARDNACALMTLKSLMGYLFQEYCACNLSGELYSPDNTVLDFSIWECTIITPVCCRLLSSAEEFETNVLCEVFPLDLIATPTA